MNRLGCYCVIYVVIGKDIIGCIYVLLIEIF